MEFFLGSDTFIVQADQLSHRVYSPLSNIETPWDLCAVSYEDDDELPSMYFDFLRPSPLLPRLTRRYPRAKDILLRDKVTLHRM